MQYWVETLGGVYEMYALVVWGQTVIGGVMASKDI
jgi:hypothetical protein